MNADIVVQLGSRGFDIGFDGNIRTGKYDVVGDWYGMRQHAKKLNDSGIERHDRFGIVSKVHEHYIKHSVSKELQKHGFRDISKKNEYVMKKQQDGRERRARRFVFQRSTF